MTKKEAIDRLEFLIAEIHKNNKLYHTLDAPEITDFEYDQLFQELLDLEQKFPELIREDSPSHKVGGAVLESFTKVQHQEPMLSLQNTYSAEEILEFEAKIQRQIKSDEAIEFFCSPKYDGVAIELVFENGQLKHGITRGDGVTGEDVFNNVKTIRNLPTKLETDNPPSRMDIRGEILLFKQDFANINEKQQDAGQKTFANPRNAAAGTIRQLDSKIAGSRNLKMFCYGLGHTDGIEFQTQLEFETSIAKMGLPVMPANTSKINPSALSTICRGGQEVIQYYNAIEKLRHDLDFDIDGIVVKVNSFVIQKQLGNIARSPRWAFAAKFTPEQAKTKIKDIVVQVGRTGALTPVAIMEPVEVGGVTITNATLHNQDEIDRKDVRIGDTVMVHRAGDVIPEIISVDQSKRDNNSKRFKIPDHCPTCNNPAEQFSDEVVKRCTNPLCPSVMKESLKHFVSRNAMNIDKMGSRLVEIFFDEKLINTFSDIYKLQYDQIIALDRQGKKSTENLLDSIENSKKTELHRLIYALGIRFVGEQTARTLAAHYRSAEAFLKATEQELMDLPDVGPRVTESILKVLSQKRFIEEVQELLKVGIAPKAIKQIEGDVSGPLSGLSFVVTGTLPLGRTEVQDLIRNAGGQITSSISKNTSVLVAGEKAGSKLAKAEKLGTEVWGWDDLQKKLS